MKKIIVVIGAPRSGKDTHAKMLSGKLNYKYFSLDYVISEEVKNKTKIGLILEKYSQSEVQAPDEYAIMLMKDAIINLKEDGIVFNNYPQTIAQAKALDSFLFSRRIEKVVPVFLNIDQFDTLNRMVENSRDSFNKTMNDYDKNKKPVVDYYTSNRIEFDTSKNNSEIINEEIIKKLKEKGC